MTYYISEFDSLSVKPAHELLRRLKESHRDGEMQHHLKRFIEDKTMNIIPTADTLDDTCDLTPNDVRKTITAHAMPHDPFAEYDAYDPALNIDPGK